MPGSAAQARLIDELMEGKHRHTRLFFLHVMSSVRADVYAVARDVIRRVAAGGAASDRTGGTVAEPGTFSTPVAIPATFIKKWFRHAEWRRLEDEGVLDASTYSRKQGRCREFRVAGWVLQRYAEAGPTAASLAREGLVDLLSGRPTTRRIKSVRTGPTRNPLPSLVRAAIDSVGPVLWNPRSVERHLGRLQRAAEAAPAGALRIGATARYVTDALCYQGALAQGARPIDPNDPDGLWTYRPAYKQQKFGRLTQIAGALQSCSRAMKEAAYRGVPDFRNYDLRASQALILIVLLAEAGLSPAWLTAYAVDGKVAAAARLGVSVDLWKEVLYATMMGGRVPSPGQLRYSNGKIATEIRKSVAPEEVYAVYGRFLEFTAELRDVLKAWHQWLDTEFIAASGRVNNIDGRTYITNAAGVSRAVDAFAPETYRRRSQLAAFLLQGRECAFVHALAASSGEFGFVVLSHEHDGLAVQGTIPEAAVERAAAVARLPLESLFLEEKPFV